MYGKFFASTFTGSMVGAGSSVFAVWGYVIANARNGSVELNPRLLAMVLGDTEESVSSAIQYLCSPDEESRTKDHEGRRLLPVGAFMYDVPNHDAYRKIANEVERREYFKEKKREERSRGKALTCGQVLTVHKMSLSDSASDSGGKEEGECRGETGEGAVPVLPAELDFTKFREAWAAFLAYRKRKRFKALLPESITAQWKILAQHGPDVACLAIEQTIANDWRGLFPEKIANGSGAQLSRREAAKAREAELHKQTNPQRGF